MQEGLKNIIAYGELIVNGESSLQEGVPGVAPQGSVLGQLLITQLINYLEGNIKLLLAKVASDTKAAVCNGKGESIARRALEQLIH